MTYDAHIPVSAGGEGDCRGEQAVCKSTCEAAGQPILQGELSHMSCAMVAATVRVTENCSDDWLQLGAGSAPGAHLERRRERRADVEHPELPRAHTGQEPAVLESPSVLHLCGAVQCSVMTAGADC